MLRLLSYGYGLTGAMNSISVALPSELGLPPAEARAGSTIVCTFLGIGFLIGPVLAGALHGVRSRYREPLLFASALLVAAAALTRTSVWSFRTPTVAKPKAPRTPTLYKQACETRRNH